MKKDILKEFDELISSEALYTQGQCDFKLDNGILKVTNRQQPYASPAIDLVKLMGEKQGYRINITLKSDNAPKTLDCVAQFEIFCANLGCNEHFYKPAFTTNVNNEGWVSVSCEFKTLVSSVYEKILLALYNIKLDDAFFDFSIKEFTVEDFIPDDTLSLDFKLPDFKRPERTQIGVIRWEAWNCDTSDEPRAAHFTAQTLSPAKYHYMAPFFSFTDEKGNIHFPVATQEQFDKEAELAIDAGIDYFAYVWDGVPKKSEFTRRQHRNSKYKDKIKMCAVVMNTIRNQPDNIDDLIDSMQDSCYLRLDGRPVVYFYGAESIKKELFEKIRDLASAAGIKEKPYFIGMADYSADSIADLFSKGCEATSNYGFNAEGEPHKGEPFQALADRAFEYNLKKFARSQYIGIVPLITFGRDSRPRIDTQLSWGVSNYGFKFTYEGTEEELYMAAHRTFDYILDHPEQAKPNMTLLYAWNEHDEGSWVCPTVAVDENGNILKNEDGTNKLNCMHLNALKRAIKEHRIRENEILGK